MIVHIILLLNRMRRRESRNVVWDDEAGIVDGEHRGVPWMQQLLAQPTPVDFGSEGRNTFYADPTHNPHD